MSKCSVFSTSKLKLPYWTLLRPKYCASAAETHRVTARKAITAARITWGLLEEPATSVGSHLRAGIMPRRRRTEASYPLRIPTVQRAILLYGHPSRAGPLRAGRSRDGHSRLLQVLL